MKRFVITLALLITGIAAGILTAWSDPFHEAVNAGDLSKVKMLLATDPSLVNAPDENGFPPLYAAIWSAAQVDQEAVVEFLLSKGANVHYESTDDGSTPLHLIAGKPGGNAKIAQLLIAKEADVNAKRKRDGATPLHDAAAFGHTEVMKVLLANKAIIDPKDNGGQTPLYFAAGEGHKEAVELLLAKGADVNVTNSIGYTPLLAAAGPARHIEVVELLIANGAKFDIFSATALGNIKEIKRLLKTNPALVHAKGDDGMTPLHLAVLTDQKGSAETLLTNKADVNAVAKDGGTPLGWAENPWLGQHKDIAELLRKHGAKH